MLATVADLADGQVSDVVFFNILGNAHQNRGDRHRAIHLEGSEEGDDIFNRDMATDRQDMGADLLQCHVHADKGGPHIAGKKQVCHHITFVEQAQCQPFGNTSGVAAGLFHGAVDEFRLAGGAAAGKRD